MIRKQEAFRKKWSLEKENWQRIFEQLENAAASEETNQKKQELLQKISWAEGVLAE
ncbi:hypothetical protein RCG23_18990 [Neobacillus sp. PS3-34]|uniref:hypothetical protein n=1 Tax=Neobacillus sp. PS3-34 TaxID=3070678 RepID=UPI0027DF9439|nr:hypothetical protein [Neobacillus sp. PS3-34]WML47488.1 hypothetical protein RCG23_18990 [Neobacillus sp. PS3-34]